MHDFSKCNVMGNYRGHEPLPFVKEGNKFYSPEGIEVAPPHSWKEVDQVQIMQWQSDRTAKAMGPVPDPPERTY
jgi:hypothetical protein